jgi:hypothetical protein
MTIHVSRKTLLAALNHYATFCEECAASAGRKKGHQFPQFEKAESNLAAKAREVRRVAAGAVSKSIQILHLED